MSERLKTYQSPTLIKHQEPILPPSGGNVNSLEEFKDEFPVRFNLWQEMSPTYDSDPLPQHLHRQLVMLNNLDKYIVAHSSGRRRLLRQNQMDVFRDIYGDLEQGQMEGFIEAPTGFGKTVLFSQLIEAMNQRTVVVVPSRILVEQTAEKLRRFNPSLDCGVFYSERKEYNKQVIVTTYQSLVQSNGGVEPDNIDVLILDEVHQSLTDYRIDAVNRFAGAIKIGFTATPEYTEDKRVANLLNHKYHKISLQEAVAQGSLSPFSAYLAETDTDISNVSITFGGEYDLDELEKAINVFTRNKSAADLYAQMVSQDPSLHKAIVYCATIQHSQDVAKVFTDAGISTAAIWSDQDAKERAAIIAAYKRGDIKVLTNVNVLTEGFDDPEAALCINLKPTRSRVVAKQRGGRVLRLDPKNPQKHAVVVDYLDKNENKRTKQITFAQVVIADDEGKAIQIETEVNQDNGESNLSPEQKDSYDDKFHIHIEGLHVVTNTVEVLKIINENSPNDELPPEGWITATSLKRELGISNTLVKKLINKAKLKLLEEDTIDDDFKMFILNSVPRQYISPRIADVVRQAAPAPVLRNALDIYTGFVTVPTAALQEEFGINIGGLYRELNALQKKYPTRFVHGRSWERWIADPEGVEMLRAHLQSRKDRIYQQSQVPEGFHIVRQSEIAKEFDMHPSSISTRIKKLKDEYPELVKGGGTGSVYYLTDEAEALLRASLEARPEKFIPPDGYYRVSIKDLAEEFGVSTGFIRNRLKDIQYVNPESVLGGSNASTPLFINNTTESTLRAILTAQTSEKIALQNFHQINVGALAEGLGVNREKAYTRLQKLRARFPEHFKLIQGKKMFVTEEGERLLRDEIIR